MDGNAPAERSGLVPLLRIHRQHPYAVLIRKFTSRWLAVLVFLAACALIHQCYTQGNNIGGWTLDVEQCRVGLTRLMFPFFGGLLLFRLCKPGRSGTASGGAACFWWERWPCRTWAGRKTSA